MPADLPQANAFLQQLGALKNRGSKAPVDRDDLSMDPSNPTYRDRLPPPDPDGVIVERTPSGQISRPRAPTPLREAQAQAPAASDKRVLVSYGPNSKSVVVSVVASDLSQVYARVTLDRESAVSVYAVLDLLAPVVDLVGIVVEAPRDSLRQDARQGAESDPAGAAVPPARPRRPSGAAGARAPQARGPAHGGSRRGADSAGRDVGPAGGADAAADA